MHTQGCKTYTNRRVIRYAQDLHCCTKGMGMLDADSIRVFAMMVLVVAVPAGAWLGQRWYQQPQRVLARRLRALSHDMITSAFLPDGLGGEIYIDRLLLTHHGLLLLDLNDSRGTIFAGEQLNIWTAQSPASRITFDNPLPLLHDRAAAIDQIAPGVPVHARIVFADDTVFAKGRPDAVTTISALCEEFGSAADPAPAETPPYAGQWDSLRSAASLP